MQLCSYRCHRKCTAIGSSCGSSNDLNSPTGSIDGPSEPRQMTRVCSLSRMPTTQREADSSSDAWQQLMADNNLVCFCSLRLYFKSALPDKRASILSTTMVAFPMAKYSTKRPRATETGIAYFRCAFAARFALTFSS